MFAHFPFATQSFVLLRISRLEQNLDYWEQLDTSFIFSDTLRGNSESFAGDLFRYRGYLVLGVSSFILLIFDSRR
jgi:hypothetical protein